MPLIALPPNLDFGRQSKELPGTRRPGQSAVWTSALYDRALLTAPDEPATLFALFENSARAHPERSLFLHRQPSPASTADSPQWTTTLVPTTYAQAQHRRNALGSALLTLERRGSLHNPASSLVSPPEIRHPGVPHYGDDNRAKAGARRGWAVGVWSKNREEWQIVDLACQAYGLVGVSLYETLGPDVAKYITNHCPLPIIVASSNHIPSLLKIAPECPSLRFVVSMDTLPASETNLLRQWAVSVGIDFLTMDELEHIGTGANAIQPGPEPGEELQDLKRITTISYTSGTTGDPKGVVLTTENVLSAIISNGKGVSTFLVNNPWMFLSFLPLSHIFERFVEINVMYAGGTIGFATGDPLKLLEDAQIYRPHFVVGVPRMWNRIHAAIMDQMQSGGLKGALVTKAVNAKLARLRETGDLTHPVYDPLVFRKIKNLMGGRLEFLGSGAAPLRPDVHDILKICFGCDVVQGFGMTETVGTCTAGLGRDVDAPGTCGRLHPCNDLKLVDVPDMNYTANDQPNPRGEVCLQGLNITPGYLHNPKATQEAIDKDGWFHTGDIGEIDPAGRLKIIDRLKNVIKLSQGEYVALEKIEGIYALDRLFASLLVHGDSARSFLVAVAVLEPDQARALVRQVLGGRVSDGDGPGGPGGSEEMEEMVQRKEVRMAVLQKLGKIAKESKLNGFEHIKGLHLTLKPFPDDILTPTFKVKRSIAAKIYAKEIEQAYARGEAEAVEASKSAKF